MTEITHKELHQVLRNYCTKESHKLTIRAGMEPQVVTNENYLSIRGRLHYLLLPEEISQAVYDLTSLLSFSELLGSPK